MPEVKQRLMLDALEQLDMLINDNEMTDLGNFDVEGTGLPQSVAEAISQVLGGGNPVGGATVELPTVPPPDALAGLSGISPVLQGPRLGGGNYPSGAAPQALSPRGPLTPKTQPMPGAVEAGSMGGFNA